MTFAEPGWLWLLLALPVLAGLELYCVRRDRRRTARLVARALWGRVVRRPQEHWRWIRLTALLIGTAGVVLALARPQWGIVREKVEREGVDVVLVLDTSGSMATEDVSPNRFFLARAALSSLVTRLEEDRFALVTFEGEAYPLVPLTLDADAVGLFLETLEPGFVPKPGSSLGDGIAKGLEMFVDKQRRNKVMVLASDGEDLEGEVEDAVKNAKKAGVIVHTVGVGTAEGEPVPDFDDEGQRVGFKKDQNGSVVVSRLNAAALTAIARGTGGSFFRITTSDTSLVGLVAAVEGMEQKALAREFSYRKKERFQLPLGIGLVALTLGLLLPLPDLRRARGQTQVVALLTGLVLLSPAPAPAQEQREPQLVDELLLRPRRLTAQALEEYERGNHPKALEAFEGAAQARPEDVQARINLADGLYKNGKFDEAEVIYQALGQDPAAAVAGAARYNLGNTRFQKQDFAGAVDAYKEALRLEPENPDTIRNLELALRALQEQQQQQQREQERREQKQEQKDEQDQEQRQDQDQQKQKQEQDQQQKQQQQQERPKTPEEKERERFQKETGMPKERAMQLLDALQENEKEEQRKLLAARKTAAKGGKDW
jgi:Ca-activated chloride channel family protein